MKRFFRVGWSLFLASYVAATACGGDDTTPCTAGTNGCACLGDDTCNGDLSCEDGICVGEGGAAGAAGSGGQQASAGASGSSAGETGDGPTSGSGGASPGSGGAAPGTGGAASGGAPAAGGQGGAPEPVCDDECDENASCRNTEAGPACVCNDGWEGVGILCTDFDECENTTHDCDPNATCDNTEGSFTCECDEYYFGPGRACALIDPATFVRDVSNAPVEWEVSGVGTFLAHGMSRIAWDIEVIETPSTPPRVLKDAGAIRIPDITVENLEPVEPATVEDLAIWAESTDTRSALVQLRGLRGETMTVALFDIAPADADTSEAGGKLASVTLSVGQMQVTRAGEYVPPTSSPAPGPATFIEVDGVTFDVSFPPADIDEIPGDEEGFIELRKIPNHHDGAQADNLIRWMEGTIESLGEDVPFIQRRAMSQIHRTGPEPSDETDRVNCFEVWPSRLYLFNPAKAYPNAFLVDVSITTEFCEDG
jgi:hypothetical protein